MFVSEYEKTQSCGSAFQCDSQRCIDPDLACDRIDHCGDYSDESAEGPAQCGVKGTKLFKVCIAIWCYGHKAYNYGNISFANYQIRL